MMDGISFELFIPLRTQSIGITSNNELRTLSLLDIAANLALPLLPKVPLEIIFPLPNEKH